MIVCDMCGESKKCFEREIEGKAYDICADCWAPMTAKLKGKGKGINEREIVLLPESQPTEPAKSTLFPGELPTIWAE